jgi:hypothetical protein
MRINSPTTNGTLSNLTQQKTASVILRNAPRLASSTPPRRHCEPPLGGVAIHLAQQDLKQAKRFFLEKEAKTSIRKALARTQSATRLINALLNKRYYLGTIWRAVGWVQPIAWHMMGCTRPADRNPALGPRGKVRH